MIALTVVGFLMLVALIAVLAVLQSRSFANHGKLAQWHHGYLLILTGWQWWPVQVVALVIGADDLYQHSRQLKTPFYRSPLHRAYYWLMART